MTDRPIDDEPPPRPPPTKPLPPPSKNGDEDDRRPLLDVTPAVPLPPRAVGPAAGVAQPQ